MGDGLAVAIEKYQYSASSYIFLVSLLFYLKWSWVYKLQNKHHINNLFWPQLLRALKIRKPGLSNLIQTMKRTLCNFSTYEDEGAL